MGDRGKGVRAVWFSFSFLYDLSEGRGGEGRVWRDKININ